MVQDNCRNAKWGCTDCKRNLAETLNEVLEPIRKRRNELLSDGGKLEAILESGREKASVLAAETMKKVRAALTF